jgi:hypothetical protein
MRPDLGERFDDLMRQADFLEAESFREDAHIACEVRRDERSRPVISYEAIA